LLIINEVISSNKSALATVLVSHFVVLPLFVVEIIGLFPFPIDEKKKNKLEITKTAITPIKRSVKDCVLGLLVASLFTGTLGFSS